MSSCGCRLITANGDQSSADAPQRAVDHILFADLSVGPLFKIIFHIGLLSDGAPDVTEKIKKNDE